MSETSDSLVGRPTTLTSCQLLNRVRELRHDSAGLLLFLFLPSYIQGRWFQLVLGDVFFHMSPKPSALTGLDVVVERVRTDLEGFSAQ